MTDWLEMEDSPSAEESALHVMHDRDDENDDDDFAEVLEELAVLDADELSVDEA